MSSKKNIKRGFSLAEILVYIGILLAMLAVIFNILIGISKSRDSLNTAQNISFSALSAIDRIEREVHLASSVNTSASTLATSPGVLVLDGLDNNGNPRSVEFSIIADELHFKENGVDKGALTDNKTRVSSLTFNRLATSTAEAVRIEMTLESGVQSKLKRETFYTTALMRQSL